MARERMTSTAAAVGERRATPRLDKVFPVLVEGDCGAAPAVARNISEGGMFVETHDPQPLGSQVRITFEAGGGEMTAVAEVRYVCHLVAKVAAAAPRHVAVRGMGVRFLYFDPAGATPPVLH